jgi:hypothetical protein
MANGLFTLKQQVYATEVGAWPNQKTPTVDYLVVAGGGAGSGGYGAGGGAGGMLAGNIPVVTNSAITVTVGAGGAAVAGNPGNAGANSVFGNILANGGGFGTGGWGGRAGSGGSGGGSGGNTGSRWWGEAVPGQGNRGGGAMSETGPALGGGGGAGTAGGMGYSGAPAGFGGNGLGTYIGGPLTVYAGGGGSSVYNNTTANVNGLGGTGGGGAGGTPGSNNGTSGTANTGGGGGGASVQPGNTTTGGNGGSGIVIISYPDVYQAPTATTGSPTVSTSGSGSMSLNGSNQTLTFASNAAFGMGTGDFTVEFWINTSDVSGDIVGVTGGFNLTLASNTMYWQSLKDTTNLYSLSGSAITNGAWHHVAVCRSGTSNRIFYDGVAQGSSPYSDVTNYGVTGNLVIGNGGVGYLAANISSLRIIKGTALYTSNFTPSSAPLTAISGTSLLLSAVSGAHLTDSSNGFVPNSSASVAPTWSQLSPFATGLGFKNRVYTWTSSGSITF